MTRLKPMPLEKRASRPQWVKDEGVKTGSGDSNAKNAAALGVRWIIATPNEGRVNIGPGSPRFANNDDPIELLALRFVNVHDLQAVGRFCTIKDLFLSKRLVKSATRIRINTIA